jgi:hypothetical protein
MKNNNTHYSVEKRNSGEEEAVTNWNKNLLSLKPFIIEYGVTSHQSFLKGPWGGGAAMRWENEFQLSFEGLRLTGTTIHNRLAGQLCIGKQRLQISMNSTKVTN